jgi:hypothetical protein
MKKILLILIFIFIPICYALSQSEHKTYCELVGVDKGLLKTKLVIYIDFGDKNKTSTIVDENGNDLIFYSMIDAMNYMAKNGWKPVQTYAIGTSQNGYVYHWLLEKNINNDTEIKEGITTKDDLKNRK